MLFLEPRGHAMRRRDFITLLCSASAAWPIAVRAQQSEQMRRIGVLMNTAADDREGQEGVAAFDQVLQQSGWAVGRNVQILTFDGVLRTMATLIANTT